MTAFLISVALLLFALAFVATVLLVIVGGIAGNVLHLGGTSSAREWLLMLLLRLFAGNQRRRLLRRVSSRPYVGIDGSRRVEPCQLVSVSPADIPLLVGPAGRLSTLADEAVAVYVKRSRDREWSIPSAPQIVVVPDELVRRGLPTVLAVSPKRLAEARLEMWAWDATVHGDADAQATPTGATAMQATRFADVDAAPTAPAPGPEAVTVGARFADQATAPAHAARVVVSDAHGRQHSITSASALIGRGPGCQIQLTSNEVSGEHLDVYLQEGTWWLRDRGSRNGTIVDGRSVLGPVPLRLGSRIVLGSVRGGEQLTIDDLDAR